MTGRHNSGIGSPLDFGYSCFHYSNLPFASSPAASGWQTVKQPPTDDCAPRSTRPPVRTARWLRRWVVGME